MSDSAPARLVVLGSGTIVPTAHRTTSCYLLDLGPAGAFLVDLGPGARLRVGDAALRRAQCRSTGRRHRTALEQQQ